MIPGDPQSHALLALALTPGLGQTLISRCIETFGSATATLGASAAQLGSIKGISANRSGELKRRINQTLESGAVERELEQAHAASVRIVHKDDDTYPALLRHIPDPPLLLWVRGELKEDDALALAVVGSRKCSHYGQEQADRLAGRCAEAGLCIVSGGAYGIDIAAHRATLRHAGRTVAVIGSGLAKPYPQDHANLFDEIVNSHSGAVISELPMQAGPKPENFPRRNRIISGMALGVLVIEAAQRSGALITARLCVEEHGRECMAVPGRVDTPAAAGCHKIIREGWATLVTSAQDILDQLGEAGQLLQATQLLKDQNASLQSTQANNASLFELNLTDPQRQLLAHVDAPRSLDELVTLTNLPASQIQAELTMLEIRGTVLRQAGSFRKR